MSEDTVYRYALTRYWDASAPILTIVMCNPSTADAFSDDATIRKCRGFAQRLGCGGIRVVNLYALRERDPAALRTHADPIGPQNDHVLRCVLQLAKENGGTVIAAWGAVAREVPGYADRVCFFLDAVREIGVEIRAFGLCKDEATPRHPLMCRYVSETITLPARGNTREQPKPSDN